MVYLGTLGYTRELEESKKGRHKKYNTISNFANSKINDIKPPLIIKLRM